MSFSSLGFVSCCSMIALPLPLFVPISVAALALGRDHVSDSIMLAYYSVNAVAPGPVDTVRFRQECADNPDQLWLDAQATVSRHPPRVQSMWSDVDSYRLVLEGQSQSKL